MEAPQNHPPRLLPFLLLALALYLCVGVLAYTRSVMFDKSTAVTIIKKEGIPLPGSGGPPGGGGGNAGEGSDDSNSADGNNSDGAESE